jgi:hypothetical protein
MIFWAQIHRLLDEDDKSVELPTGYELEAAGTNLLLKRPRGCYEPVRRMPAACWRKRQANATK